MKKIEDNLLAVTNCIFKNKQDWKYITDDQKVKYFFIINRLLSKKYPDISQLLNLKSIDYVVGMDLIFEFMKDKPYPTWFWSKSSKQDTKDLTSEERFNLIKHFNITYDELDFLIKNFPTELEEEKKYLKTLQK